VTFALQNLNVLQSLLHDPRYALLVMAALSQALNGLQRMLEPSVSGTTQVLDVSTGDAAASTTALPQP
jgi:hypothetical protein